MNFIQRRALAESIGVGVDQLAKFINNQNKVKTLNDTLAEQDGWKQLVGDASLDNITRIVNQFKVIGAELITSIGPQLTVMAGSLADFLQGLVQSKQVLPAIATVMGVLAAKSMLVAGAQIAAAFARNPIAAGVGTALSVGAIMMMKSKIQSAGAEIASAQSGGITSQEGLVNVHPQEAIVPISKLADFMEDAMAPVVAAVNKLNEDFKNKHVPALAQSNIDGAKKSSREIGRQFQLNEAG
jgi:hypothetical protein